MFDGLPNVLCMMQSVLVSGRIVTVSLTLQHEAAWDRILS